MRLSRSLTFGSECEVSDFDRLRDEWRGFHDCFSAGKILAPIMPWVEIGGGSGALADQIKLNGGRIVTTDYHDYREFDIGTWDKSKTIKAEAERVGRLVSKFPNVGLLSAWPESDKDWCFRAVNHLQIGQTFAYIGEGIDGCTGDEQLHICLAIDFDIQDEHYIDTAPAINDRLVIYKRISNFKQKGSK